MPKTALFIAVLAASGCTSLPSRAPLRMMDIAQIEPADIQVFCDVVNHGQEPVCVRHSHKTPEVALAISPQQHQMIDVEEMLKNEPILIVNFDFNESVLKEAEKQKLISMLTGKFQGKTMYLKGYTDDVGTATYNTLLAMKRADAVKQYLVSQGLPSESLNALGVGLCCYVADNKAADGRERNRRVEVYIDVKR
jgi:outer membrane protein OmpA-like peptidoglycan-associated protein